MKGQEASVRGAALCREWERWDKLWEREGDGCCHGGWQGLRGEESEGMVEGMEKRLTVGLGMGSGW